jgi:parvulin-like peptidyl-prolyl isomerase
MFPSRPVATLAVLLLAAGCATGGSPAPLPPAAPAARSADHPTPGAQAPAAAVKPAPPAVVLARVGDETITVEEFTLEMARRGGRIPGQFATVEQRRALLDEMIQQRAALAQARAEGLDRDLEYRATIERMLTTQYLQAHLEPELEKIEVSAEEIAAFYAAHQDEFLTPERIRVAWIFLGVSAKADAAQVEKVRQRLVAARDEASKLGAETRNFGAIARNISEDPATRYVGGEIGWIYLDQAESYRWGPDVVRNSFALPAPGALSDVLRHEKGWYLLKLIEREEAKPTPIEKLSGGIRSRILKERREAARAAFYAHLLAGMTVNVDAARLAAIEPISGPRPPASPPPPLPQN